MNKTDDIIKHIKVNIAQYLGETTYLKAKGWSMKPLIHTDDLLIIHKCEKKIGRGEIVIYRRSDDIAWIAHRVINRYQTRDGFIYVLKGDSSPFVDCLFAKPSDIIGIVKEIHHTTGKITRSTSAKYIILKKILPLIPLISIWLYQIKPFIHIKRKRG